MNYIKHLLKSYPVTSFYILTIWILCFASIPQTPLDNVTLIDKWVHTAMYLGTFGTLWLEYVPACMARASNDERTYRDTASHMHWRKKVGRMARLCCQLNRSDIGGDRRNYLDENKKQTSAIGIALVNSEDYSTTIVFSNELIPLSVTTSTTNRYLPFSLATIDCDETVGSPDNPIGV